MTFMQLDLITRRTFKRLFQLNTRFPW